jgi:glutamate 5-kinase
VGSSLVTNEGRGSTPSHRQLVRQLAALARQGREVVMVSSGAIAEGMKRLGWTTARGVHELQAAAAVGQMGLAQMYEPSCASTAWAAPRCC